MQVLASHDERHRRFQRRNGTAAGKVPNGTKAADDGEAKASTTRSLRDRLNRPYEERDAELVVELLNVRKKLNFKETASEAADPATQQRSRERIKCYAYLAVWDNRPGSNSSEPICKQTQTCIFHPYQSSLGAPAVHVEMDHPFTIRANDLHVSVEKNGQRTMGIGDKYFLEIKVLPFTSNDMWPPIPILNKSDGSLNPDGTKRVFGSLEGYLVGNYLNLPFAPADAVPLSVAFDQGGRTHKTKYGFEVKSYWRSAPTPLEQRIKVEEPAAAPMSWIPDLQPVDTARQPKRKQKPASEPTKEVRRVAHLSDTLQFHLTSNHPKFSFSVEKEELGVDWNRPPRVYIKVEEAEIFRERASDHVKDPREMVWTAPKRPLDVDAYLNGDSRWLGGPLKKRKVVKPISERTKPTNLLAPPIFRLPSQVPDLKPPNRTRNPVPEPKVSQPTPFYASISHQVFEQGEECSESDDEIDQSWLKQKHTAKLQEQRHGWFENDIQRRLRIAFDSHLIDERLPNTRYVSDAFVRFLRKQEDAHWLWTEEGEVEILKLCSEMFEDRVMNEEVFAGIVQMLEERKKHSTSDSSPQITEAALSTMDARTCRQDTPAVKLCRRGGHMDP
ncbi:putative polycomb protein vefs-box [Phaeomoniella chlamydospora]|uniref:Putative polycomb protein vefs-box n=1 Tax=Phaeomoniella chlamydospora TaxID=158046 RepID=A0A0G2FWN3_PHACM|nr:putative polycomb protein vefs-box [Phaeomoniella chlamydospora]